MVSTGNDFLLQTLYVVTQDNIKLKSKFKLWILPLTPQSASTTSLSTRVILLFQSFIEAI